MNAAPTFLPPLQRGEMGRRDSGGPKGALRWMSALRHLRTFGDAPNRCMVYSSVFGLIGVLVVSKRALLVSLSGLILAGCHAFYGGEGFLSVPMHRVADGAKTVCIGGVYASGGIYNDERNARRIMNACVLACRSKGFIEDGKSLAISEKDARLRPNEGWANTPSVCQG